jgi:insulysin
MAKEAPKAFDRKEKWMGAKYFVDDPIQATDFAMRPEVGIPEPNQFMPQELKLHHSANSNSIPLELVNLPGMQMYYMPDNEFFVPECAMIFKFRTPILKAGSPKSQALANLFVRFVHETLNEVSYEASNAGLHYDVWIEKKTGLSISVHGYSEKGVNSII